MHNGLFNLGWLVAVLIVDLIDRDPLANYEIVVETEMRVKQHVAMELFASFLCGIAMNSRSTLAEFAAQGSDSVDLIARTLVELGICNKLWEGRIPVLSVLLANNIHF